jgi:hypothetical protein
MKAAAAPGGPRPARRLRKHFDNGRLNRARSVAEGRPAVKDEGAREKNVRLWEQRAEFLISDF